MTLPILVIGEALIDIVHAPDGSVSEFAGGSPANVAITLGRLGQRAQLFSWFGTDAHGELLLQHLTDSHVTLISGTQDADHTPTALARLDATGAAQYVFDIEWKLAHTNISEPVRALHIGSIAAVLEPGATAVAKIVRAQRDQAIITYDPNMRPDLMGRPEDVRGRVEELVSLSDVVKVSDEDLNWLYPGADLIDVAQRWQESGPSLIVITRGGIGASAITATNRIDVTAPKVTVADTVGAGDSFMGALINYLACHNLLDVNQREVLASLDSVTVTELLEHAAQVAAITVSRPGANPPWLHELAQ